jgi:FkbM family methyltransferase
MQWFVTVCMVLGGRRQAVVEWTLPHGTRRRSLAQQFARLVRGTRESKMAERWDEWATTHPDVFFIQIGSHDGRTGGDPLARHLDANPKWRGVMVEPIPEHFANLHANRPDRRFTLLQVAISDVPGTLTMWTVDADPDLPAFVTQMSTLDRALLERHALAIPGMAERIRAVNVEVITFQDVLDIAHVEHVDVIHIDAEGHDAAIFRQIDLDVLRPSLVQLEHRHLSQPDIDECVRRLKTAGYRLTFDEYDLLGIRPDA